MNDNNNELRKKLVELRETTMADTKYAVKFYYDRIENYIKILEYCILNLNPESYHTIMTIKDFVVEKYKFFLQDYEDLADEILEKRHQKEDEDLLKKIDNLDEELEDDFKDVEINDDGKKELSKGLEPMIRELREEKVLSEKVLFFIEWFLIGSSEIMSENIRNKIAHGISNLNQFNEIYTKHNALSIILIYLSLSKLRFTDNLYQAKKNKQNK